MIYILLLGMYSVCREQ